MSLLQTQSLFFETSIHASRPLCNIVASVFGLAAFPATSQSHKACKIDTAPSTEADIAFYRRDFKKAERLYRSTDSRSREHLIDSLLAQHRSDEADKFLSDWIADKPEDSYAISASADIRFAEGDWLTSYGLNLRALKVDPCNADAFSGLADYESLAGFHATAQKHNTIAHQLEPNQENFRSRWISGLPHAQQIQEGRKYLEDSKALDDRLRATVAKNFETAEALSQNDCNLVSSNGPAVIPIMPMYNPGSNEIAHYGLEVAFNGHKRILQIDTGAGGFLLTHSAGASISMPAIMKSRAGGFGDQGANGSELERADSVRVGGLEFHNCTVSVLSNYGAMGGGHIESNRLDNKDGLVGSNIFERYLVTLDYIKHEVRLDPLPQLPKAPAVAPDPLGGSNDPDWLHADRYVATSMQQWTSIYRRGHYLIMPTRLNGTTTRMFIVDTGNFVNLIDVKAAKEITKNQSGINRIQGLSGISSLSEAGSFTADFAGIRLPIKNTDSLDLSHWGEGVSGFLGYPTLQQLVIHIDYRDNLMLFEAPMGKKL